MSLDGTLSHIPILKSPLYFITQLFPTPGLGLRPSFFCDAKYDRVAMLFDRTAFFIDMIIVLKVYKFENGITLNEGV